MNFKTEKIYLIGAAVILGLIFVVSTPSVSAAECGEYNRNLQISSIASIFNPLTSFIEKTAKGFGYNIVSAASPDPDLCGSDSVGCSGASPQATISWTPYPYGNVAFYVLFASGMWPINVGAGTSYTLTGLANNTTYDWAIDAVIAYYGNHVCGYPIDWGVPPSGSMTCPRGSFTTPNCATYTLSVSKSGSGSGTVTSSPAGINCGSDCSETYSAGTPVTLSASPASGSTFSGWSGEGCSGTGTCTVSMTQARNVTATFNLSSATLTVTKSGTGSGTVTSNPSGINCGSDCSEIYSAGTPVTLTPSPAGGSTFAGWSGDSDCSDGMVTMNSSKTCNAIFNVIPADFSLNSSNNIYATIIGGQPGDSTATTLTVTPFYGFSSTVSLSVESVDPSLPAGSSFSFAPSNLPQSKYSSGSQFSVHIGAGASASEVYTIIVRGQDGGLVRTTTVILNAQVQNPTWHEF
jgi:hypothetical protein